MRETRVQDPNNRQKSIATDDEELRTVFENKQREIHQKAINEYKYLLSIGVAKEQARCVLPEGLTGSRIYMAGTLRSWIHYCDLRMGHGTQKEHIDIAVPAWHIVTENFPSLNGLFDK